MRLPVLLAPIALACACAAAVVPANQADRLRREGKVAAAYAAYGQALCAEPGRFDLARHLVESWDGLGQPGRPAAVLRGCSLPPAVGAYVEGLTDGAGGHYPEAERWLAQATRDAPAAERAEVLLRRGLVALTAGQADQALAHLQEAAGVAPERADIRVALARTRLALGQLDNAVTELRGMMSIAPSREDVQHGQEVLRAIVARGRAPLPEGVEATVREALGALDRGDLDRPGMLRLLELATEAPVAQVLTVAGIAALRFGVDREGTRLLEQAAQAEPLDPDPWRALGLWQVSAERLAQAVPPLRQALERDPFDRAVAQKLAEAARAVGDAATARAALRALVVLEPSIVAHRLDLARVERGLGDLSAARATAEAGYALDPQNIPLLLERAVINAQLARSAPTAEERREAEAVTRSSIAALLEVSPDHPGAESILASLGR